jgi:hypothetical protein
MKIYENWNSTYSDAINHYWKFSNFSNNDDKNAIFFGWTFMENFDHYQREIGKYQNRLYWNSEHPCVLQTRDERLISLSVDSHKIFNKVFTPCPYTANWVNFLEDSERFEQIFIPFNLNDVVGEREEKIYDALYWGGIHGTDHIEILDSIKNFKYNYLGTTPVDWNLWFPDRPNKNPPPIQDYVSLITGHNLHRPSMWKLLRMTKVNVISNLLYIDDKIIHNIKQHDQWDKNKAFFHTDQYILPNLKTRPIETAVNKCLMVVRKDPWNIIEDFFEPGREFIYYEDKKDLQYILEDVKFDCSTTSTGGTTAYKKAINTYTTHHFIDQIKKECI